MLEDNFTWVLRKALRGLNLTAGEAASLAGLEENAVQAFAAPLGLPVPRLRIRMPVVPCTAVVGTSSVTLAGVPVGEAVATWVHSLASYTKLWL